MSTVTEYTLSEMILLAAHQLDDQGRAPFSAEELIVASWQQFPRAFGLKGYTDRYPDSNRVLSSIMGEKGLTRKGWLAKMGQKLYSLSGDGKRAVQRLLAGEPPPEEEAPVARLPKDQEKVLAGLLDSPTLQKLTSKKALELSFIDACRFWGISDNLGPDAIDERVDRIERTLHQAEKLTSRGEALTVGHREVTSADIEVVRNAHEHLQDRFSRHLSLLRSRAR